MKQRATLRSTALAGSFASAVGGGCLAVLATSLALSAAAQVGGAGVGPGKAQLLPYGEFAARDGRPGPGKTWKVDNDTGRLIASRLTAIAERTPIVIDYEHQTLTAAEKGHQAPAAGWIKSVEWLDGRGAFATVDWTAKAAKAIDDKEYLYISPVLVFDEDTGQVAEVLMAALTNYPGLLGMLPAQAAALTGALAALSSPQPRQETPAMNREQLLALLGLPANATDAQINTAVAALAGELPALRTAAVEVSQLRARPLLSAALAGALGVAATADETVALSAVQQLRAAQAGGDATVATTIAALQGEIASLKGVNMEREITAEVDRAIADGKFLPAVREYLLGMGRKDLAALRGYVAAQPKIPGLGGQSTEQHQQQGSGQGTAALAGQANAVAAAFGLSAEQFAKAAPAA